MSSYKQWVPFVFACRLRCLQQGALNVGNTRQNIANLLSLARTNANSTATWARWSTAANMKTGSAQPTQALQIFPAKVPGFVKPIAS